MKSYRESLLIILFSILLFTAYGQEVCDNGIDDDSDGFIDCYDSECSGSPACLNFYFGNAVLCQDPPTINPSFGLRQQWGSDIETALNSSTPAIGDIDNDGVPEVISTNRLARTVSILNGTTGATELQINVGFQPATTIAIANLDDDDCGEIFVRMFNGREIKMFDCQMNEIWSVRLDFSQRRANIISLADFNHDGVVELLTGNEIRNAHTGDVIIAGLGNFRTEVMYGTLAIDILADADCADCSGLELLEGANIYSINISTGTRTLVRNMNDILPLGERFFPKYYGNSQNQWSMMSVADYNLDGFIDILMTGAQGFSYRDPTTAFFWDVENNNVLTFTDNGNNHSKGTGRINIGDTDGDGQLNANYVSNQTLYSLDENMNLLWSKGIAEGSSGFTGCTIFDFDGDGASETVYRSESTLHIIDGTDGSTSSSRVCKSRTFDEYPIVADVDGDGASEICVTCSFDDNLSFNPFSNGIFGHIRVYESDNEIWQPSRSVWNQHGYFNVNINDNLTIPRVQQDQTKVFSINVCTSGSNRPLNVFLNQAPFFDETGCPSYVAPDITLLSTGITTTTPQCPNLNFNASFNIQNAGDIGLSGLLPVTFYDGDPSQASSTRLNTNIITLASFAVGEVFPISTPVIGANGSDFNLFIVVNDNGNQNPPIANFFGSIPECQDNNNVTSIPVTVLPFTLSVTKVKDNEKCDPNLPNNGVSRAFFFSTTSGGTLNTLWEENFDDLSNNDTIDNGSTAWSRTVASNTDFAEVRHIGNGDNEFYARDTDGEVIFTTETINISGQSNVSVNMNLREVGQHEPSDMIQVSYILDGRSEVLFTTSGRVVDDFGSAIASVSNLNGTSLIIKVIFLNNGNNEYLYIDDIIVTGTTNSVNSEVTANHTFQWFNGTNFSTPVFTGHTYSNMATGDFSVFGVNDINGCISDTLSITIASEQVNPIVVITPVSPVTDCVNPDGALSAAVNENGVMVTDGYDFTWYFGNDFTAAQSVGPNAVSLQAVSYSVVVRNQLTGCESVLSKAVNTSLTFPPLRIDAITHIVNCNNLTGGSITASSAGITNGFTFNWYNGSGIKLAPDFSGSGSLGATYSGLTFGFYTVHIIDNSNGCISAPMMVEVLNNAGVPLIEVATISQNTSCTSSGLGSFSVTSGGETTGFTFQFYQGSNTLSANLLTLVSGDNNNTSQFLSSGDYTIVVTDNNTGCFNRATTTITSAIEIPTVNEALIVVNQSASCISNGTGQINASTAVTVTGSTSNNSGVITEISSTTNGGFESPIVPSRFDQILQTNVSGWSTTSTDNRIEIWHDGFQGVPAFEGNQFAEINATQDAALYFDLVTRPGIEMDWSFAHRGRRGLDSIRLLIGPTGGTPVEQGRFGTDNTNWVEYIGEYTIPTGQTVTRFQYESISTRGGLGSQSVGNFLDAISFTVVPIRYSLYTGSNSSATPLTTNSTGIFNNLAAGTYTLEITNSITGCSYQDIILVVPSIPDNPIIGFGGSTGDTYCRIGGVGNGSVLITSLSSIAEPANGYRYDLYNGNDTTNLNQSQTIQDGSVGYTFNSLGDGNYRIKTTNLDLICSSIADFVIDDDATSPPVFGIPIIAAQSSCPPSSNGSISITVILRNDADFMFSWYSGGRIGGTPAFGPLLGLNNITGLSSGDYTVVAENPTTGCTVNQLTINVPSNTDNPTITIVEVQAQNACVNPNGSLSAYVTEIGRGTTRLIESDGYTFEWFVGNASAGTALTTAGNSGGNGSNLTLPLGAGIYSTIGGLAAPSGSATYTVRATNSNTRCMNTRSIILTNSQNRPVITGAVSLDNTACTRNFNGSLTVSASLNGVALTLPDPNYTFEWYQGVGLSGGLLLAVGGVNSNILNGLEDGDYTVVINDITSGCVSDPQVYTVNANQLVFDIVATVFPNGNCSGPANGRLQATIEINGTAQATTDYTFEWFEGANVTTPLTAPATVSGINDSEAINLSSNDYTVRVTDIATGCLFSTTAAITDVNVMSFITRQTHTNDTDCSSGGNGSITISEIVEIVNGSRVTSTISDINTNFILELFDATLTTSMGIISTPSANNLDPGTYYVAATRRVGSGPGSGCRVNSDPIIINDNTITPIINIVQIIADQACSGGTETGALSASIDETALGGITGVINNYNFQWYLGSNLNDISNLVPNANGGNTDRIFNVGGGDYFVIVTDALTLYNGCESRLSFTLSENNPVYTIATNNKVNINVCEGTNTGSFSITDINTNGMSNGGITGFTFSFFDNSSNQISTGNPAGVTITGAVATGLAVEAYSVSITNTTTNCESIPLNFNIIDESSQPQISISTYTANTSCVTSSPNGGLTVVVNNPDGGTYSYTWYAGADVNDTSTPLVNGTTPSTATNGVTTATVSGLPAGDYWVLVEDDDNSSACLAKISAIVIDSSAVISIDSITSTSNTQCTPNIGSIRVTQMTVNGIVITDPAVMANYTFKIYDNANAYIKDFETQATAPATFPLTTALDSGTYFIQAEDNNVALQCASNSKQVQISGLFTEPILTISNSPNTACAGSSLPDGAITVSVGNSVTGDTFSYQWYFGNGTGTPLANGVDPGNNSNPNNVTTNNVTGLYGGTYTVEVTVTASGSGSTLSLGCSATATFTLTDDTPVITITSSSNDISGCSGTVSGNFDITQVLENGIDGIVTLGNTYNYTFYNSDATVLSATSTIDNVTGLTAGDYYVVVNDVNSNCQSANINFQILDSSIPPQISISNNIANTSCVTLSPNGGLTVVVNNPDGGTYSYTWYAGAFNNTSTPLVNGTTPSIVTTGVTTTTVSGLPAGDYWVLVEDDDNPSVCLAKISATVIYNPAVITISGITIVHQNDCTPVNGKIDISSIIVNGNTLTTEVALFGYNFDLYNSTNTLIRTFDNHTNTTFPSTAANLSAGTYYVLVTDKAITDCPSALYEVIINDDTVDPALTIREDNPNTICSGTFNGEASVSITGGSGTYTYQWYVGNDLNNTGIPVVGATTANLIQVSAGFYWVLVSDQTSPGVGCTSRISVEVTENIDVISIETSDLTFTPKTLCSSDNGSATVAEVTVNGSGLGNTTGYSFIWYTSGGVIVTPQITTPSRNDLAPGTYNVIARNPVTNCESLPISFTIGDNTVNPVLVGNSSVTNSTSCDITIFPNGSASFNPDATTTPADGTYAYQWYAGTTNTIGPATSIAGATTYTITRQQPGTYSIVVTTVLSQCSSIGQVIIAQDPTIDPIITSVVNGTPVTNCTTPDGVVTATVGSLTPNDYNWFWFDDSTATTRLTRLGTISNNVVTGLDEKTYSVYIENILTGCRSTVSKVRVTRDPAADITINIYKTQPGTCNGPTGQLRIESSSPSSTFTFAVYKGESDLTTSPEVVALSINDLSVSETTGGVSDNNNVSYPTGNNIDDNDGTTDYEVSNLINDTYTVVATDLTTGCTERKVFVLFFAEVQRVDVDPIVRRNAENCLPYAVGGTGGTGGNTGTVDIIMRLPASNTIATHDNYQIFLYQGNTANPPPDMSGVPGEWTVVEGRNALIQANAGTIAGQTIDTSTPQSIIYNSAIGLFQVGETITGGTSTATAEIATINNDTLILVPTTVVGTFEDGETITGGTSTTTATIDTYSTNGYNDRLNTYSFAGLTAGIYAVVAAEERTTFCYSPPVTFQIFDQTDALAIDLTADVTIVDNADCTGLNINAAGSIRIDRITRGADIDNGSTALAANYDFAWYVGTSNAGNRIDALPDAGYGNLSVSGNQAIDLPAGSYFVEITKINPGANNDEEACIASYIYNVFDNVPTFTVVSATATDVTNCVPDNGTVTINNVDVSGTPASFTTVTGAYDFLLYKGNTLINGGNPNVPLVTGLDAGTYSIVIQEQSTSCVSVPYDVTISNSQTNPNLPLPTIVHNTACNTAANGSITVDLGSAISNYTIEWFIDNVNSGVLVPTANINNAGNDAVLSAIEGGTYALRVTGIVVPGVGCVSIASFNVNDNINAITSFVATSTDVTNCTTPNGIITVSQVTQTSGSPITGSTVIDASFEILLYDNSFSPIAGTYTSEITSLNAGTYFVVVENRTTRCQSDPVQYIINDASINPEIVLTTTDNTMCSPENGSASVTITNDDGGTYNYQWYLGGDINDVTNPLVNGSTPTVSTAGVTTASATGLSAGAYWVSVTDAQNPSNGCAAKGVVNIIETIDLIEIASITITPASDCSGTNATGMIEVTGLMINSNPASTVGYTFAFFAANNTITPVSTVNPYTSVVPGDYFVVAVSTATGCTSNPVQRTVNSVPANPDLNTTILNTSSCRTTPDGNITVQINDLANPGSFLDPRDFTFRWYVGSQTTSATQITAATSSILLTLPANSVRTVIVTSNVIPGIGCATTATYTVGDDRPNVMITSVNATASRDCNGTGQIEITGFTNNGTPIGFANMRNYAYTLYDDRLISLGSFNTLPNGRNSNPIMDSLASGTYFISVTDNASGCETDLVEVVIGDNSINPNLSISIAAQNTICSGSFDGSLTVSVIGGDGNYDYVWHSGSDINVVNPIGQTTATATALQSGFYWVEVTDNMNDNNTCSAKAIIELTNNLGIIDIEIADITITPASNCSVTNDTGAIEVTDVTITTNGVTETSISTSGYTFEFFAAANINVPVSSVNPYASVVPGDYFIVATNTVTGCTSSPVQVTVGIDAANPVARFTENSPNSSCAALNYNGSLTVNIDDISGVARPATDFTYQWYFGGQVLTTSVVPPVNGGNIQTISNVRHGEFTVVVTIINGMGLRCRSISTTILSDNLPTLFITRTNETANNNCNPNENGRTEIRELTVNGSVLTSEAAIDDYTFELFDENFGSLGAFATPGTSTNFPSTSNLVSGVYYIVATNSNGCITPPFQITINDISNNPTIIFTMESADQSCNGTNVTGSLSVIVDGGNIADHTVEWFTGDLTAPAINPVNSANISVSGNKSIISNVAAGPYHVRITDTTVPGNGCQVLGTALIESSLLQITVPVIRTINNTNCAVPFNGDVSGVQVTENGSLLNSIRTAADYTFSYFDEGLNILVNNNTLRGGNYYVIATHTATGCQSDPTLGEVGDDLDNLEVTFTSTPNTLCIAAGTYNGNIAATVTYNGNTFIGRYTFQWYDGVNVGVGLITAGISSGVTDNISIVSNLQSKQYSVRITDNTTNCSISAISTVSELLDIPTLNIPDARITDNTTCDILNYNGSIILVPVDISGNVLNKFDLELFMENSSGTLISIATQMRNNPTLGRFTSLGPGKYYIVATDTASFCGTALTQAIIENQVTIPQITITNLQAATGCSPGTGLSTGSISVLSNGFIETNPNYTFQWYSGNSVIAGTLLTGETNATINTLVSGTYTIYTQNRITTCERELAIDVPQSGKILSISNFTTIDQTTCNGNGNITITELRFGGVITAASDFDFTWSSSTGTTVAQGNGINQINEPTGIYYVSLLHTPTNCPSTSVTQIEIGESITYPYIFITENVPDRTCAGSSNNNGVLSALADGVNDSNPNYNFEWFSGTSALAGGTGIATTSSISNRIAGPYTVRVSVNSTGCQGTETFTLSNIPLTPKILTVDTISMTVCNSVNGGIRITSVSPGNLGGYTYQFYANTFPSASIQDSNDRFISGLRSGTYFVTITDILTSCISEVNQIDIPDNSIFPVLAQELNSSLLQTSCNLSMPNGVITISADGITDISLYNFEWYAGNQPVSGLVIANTPTISNIGTGNYTIRVTNLSTGCSSINTYIMENSLVNPILLNVSSEGNSNCVNPNGSLGVAVINEYQNTNYGYYWYNGMQTSKTNLPSPFFNQKHLNNIVAGGVYTILVRDLDRSCESDLVSIQVDNNISNPVFSIMEDASLTNCDLLRPNGLASAVVADINLSRYYFEWYAKMDTIGSPFFVGITADSLTNITYTVAIVDRYTGCESISMLTIRDETQVVPNPNVEILSHRTNCLIPNGEATASINGNILDYNFIWFASNQTDIIGNNVSIRGLDVSQYYVKSSNILTGCTSADMAKITIRDETVLPVFTFLTTESVCELNNGTADPIFKKSTEIDSAVWKLNGTIVSTDFKLINAMPGDYSLFIRDGNNCDFENTFSIKTDIIVYNGVSFNGDSFNDIFLIDCAQHFPQNQVKIYNRSGNLIYEEGGYNNTDKSFNGIANRGSSSSSSGLPSGTYFYLIDKGDGSDTIQGYLELIR